MSLRQSVSSILGSLVATFVLIVVGAIVASALGSGRAWFLLGLDLLLLGVVAAGVLLIARGRPIAGAGAIVTAISVWVAMDYTIPGLMWTVLFFVGIGLVVYGTRADTVDRGAWPLVLIRVGFGWAWLDNAQDHIRAGTWLPANVATAGSFANQANTAANRAPMYFLDPIYQGFLKGVIVPNADVWAGLTITGEMAFGTLLALGLLTQVAAWGAMWHSFNYFNMKSSTVHGGYTDKVFFLADLVTLVTGAGLVYGLDASLRHVVPAPVARYLMGAPVAADADPMPSPAPVPA